MMSVVRLAHCCGATLISCAELAGRAGCVAEAQELIDLAYAIFARRIERMRARSSGLP